MVLVGDDGGEGEPGEAALQTAEVGEPVQVAGGVGSPEQVDRWWVVCAGHLHYQGAQRGQAGVDGDHHDAGRGVVAGGDAESAGRIGDDPGLADLGFACGRRAVELQVAGLVRRQRRGVLLPLVRRSGGPDLQRLPGPPCLRGRRLQSHDGGLCGAVRDLEHRRGQ